MKVPDPNQSQEIHRLQTNNSNRGSKMDVSNDFAAEDLFGGEYLYYATTNGQFKSKSDVLFYQMMTKIKC